MSTKSPAVSISSKEAETFLSRTLLVPVLFVSFLFSLFIVDRNTSASIFSPSQAASPERERFYHSYQRKLAKREIDDAFVLRRRVIVAMCIACAIGIVGAGWCLSMAWRWWGYKILA